MFVSPALAQEAGNVVAGAPSALSGILPMVLMFAVLYFLLLRPQQKKYKDHQGMLKALRRGDRIVTSGGIVGVIHKIDEAEDMLTLEIAENVRVKLVRSMVASVVSRTGEVEVPSKDKKAA